MLPLLRIYPISLFTFLSKRNCSSFSQLTVGPILCTHFCEGPRFATNIHLFKTDTPTYNISSINLEVFCKHKVSLCLNLTKQLRWQSDRLQLIYAVVDAITLVKITYGTDLTQQRSDACLPLKDFASRTMSLKASATRTLRGVESIVPLRTILSCFPADRRKLKWVY